MNTLDLLSNLVGGGGYGGGFMGVGGVRSAVSAQFRAYSMGFLEKGDKLDDGDKVVLPPSFFERLTQADVQFPMQFSAVNPSSGVSTHCGVIEFTAEEGRVYMPYGVMQNLALEEGQFVQLTSAKLPLCTFAKFRPNETEFIRLSNPKAVLERHLPKFSCLTKGDTLIVPYQGKKYRILVLDLKPGVRRAASRACSSAPPPPLAFAIPLLCFFDFLIHLTYFCPPPPFPLPPCF